MNVDRRSRILFYVGLFFFFLQLMLQTTMNLTLWGRGSILAVEFFLWFAVSLMVLACCFRGSFRYFSSAVDCSLLLLFGLLVLSVLLPGTNHKLVALVQGWHWVTAMLLFVVTMNLFSSKMNPRVVVIAWTGLALVLSLYGLAQRYIIYPDLLHAVTAGQVSLPGKADADPGEFMTRLRAMQPNGPYNSPNELGGMLCMFFPLLVMLIVQARKQGRNVLALCNAIGLCLLGLCLLLTDSKGGIVAAGLGSVLACIACYKGRCKPAVVTWGLLLAAGIIITFSAAFVDHPVMHQNARTMQADSVLAKAGRSMLIRAQYWQIAGDILQQAPVFGIGPDNYSDHFSVHRIPEGEETRIVHNNYLELAVSLGWVGMAVLLFGIGCFFRRLYDSDSDVQVAQPFDNNQDVKRLLLLLCCGMLLGGGWLVNAFEFSVSNQDPRHGSQWMFAVVATAVWLLFSWGNWKLVSDSRGNDEIRYGLLGAVAAFSFHGLVDYGANATPVLQVAALLAAALLAIPGCKLLWSLSGASVYRGLLLCSPIFIAASVLGLWLSPGLMALDVPINYSKMSPRLGQRGAGALFRVDDSWLAYYDEDVHVILADYYHTKWRMAVKRDDADSELFLQRAESAYRRSLQINPHASGSAHALGQLYGELATDQFNRAAELDAASAEALRRNANRLQTLWQLPQLELATTLYPAHPGYHLSLATCLWKLGQAGGGNEKAAARKEYLLASELSKRQFHKRLQLNAETLDMIQERTQE